jgi:long-chain acyl-CoA synthetase
VTTYQDKPWLARYDDGLPASIDREHDSALAMFRASAARTPDGVAMHYFDRPIRFAELDEATDALAVALRELGVDRGDRVGLYLQNVPQFVIGMVAGWKAGATLVSLNPMYKGREVDTVLKDSGAVALITLESLWQEVAKEVVPDSDVRIVVTTSELDFLADTVPAPLAASRRDRDPDVHDLVELIERHRGAGAPDPGLGPDDVAFLTYTSGTTGPPKGAMNTHGNVVFNSQVYREWMSIDEHDVVLGVAPLFHITGLVGHIGISLLSSAPLVLGYRFDPEATLDLIEQHRVTFVIGAITVYIALMNAPSAASRDLSSLRKAYSGGAPIAPTTVEAFEERFGAYIHNIYGLTETTSPALGVPFHAKAPVDPTSGALSVGVPVFDTLVTVVGEDRQELPVGEVGEFVIRGPEVVPGYWNKPEETENAIPGGALHTGDVGFMDQDGWFYLVDRKKDQINAAGYKVWPREVEDVLYAHSAVREAAVVGVPDEYRGESVKAFVSLNPGVEVTTDELIAFCRERMAAYKYPRTIDLVDELPKTPTGKILRRLLRDREWGKNSD